MKVKRNLLSKASLIMSVVVLGVVILNYFYLQQKSLEDFKKIVHYAQLCAGEQHCIISVDYNKQNISTSCEEIVFKECIMRYMMGIHRNNPNMF